MPCYTWQRDCLADQVPCGAAQQSYAVPSFCPETATWFWITAAIVGGMLLFKGGRK